MLKNGVKLNLDHRAFKKKGFENLLQELDGKTQIQSGLLPRSALSTNGIRKLSIKRKIKIFP